jgi:hypothetical protein
MNITSRGPTAPRAAAEAICGRTCQSIKQWPRVVLNETDRHVGGLGAWLQLAAESASRMDGVRGHGPGPAAETLCGS